MLRLAQVLLFSLSLGTCTWETRNRFGHALQNWTGTNDVLFNYLEKKCGIGNFKVRLVDGAGNTF